MPDDDPKRIEEIEKRIKALEGLVGELSRALPSQGAAEAGRSADAVRKLWSQQAAPSQMPAQVRTPPLVEPVREVRMDSPAPKRDWEALIGRYGTLALATVSGLTAVGTFIGWAISKGWLGPTQRVGLGLIAAAGLAAVGLRMRKKERSFGSTLLGLSLAVIHVCAWGAGPSLHLVPPNVAFALASLASVALALLARIEEDQPLWCIGFIGAALAPFVTSSGSGNMPLLAAYGLAVLTASGRALGMRAWTVAGRLFGTASAVYVGTLMLGTEVNHGPLLALALPLAVGFAGVLPWVRGELRRDRLRPLGALAAIAAIRAAYSGLTSDVATEWMQHAFAIGGAGIAWLTLVDLSAVVPAPEAGEVKRRGERDWIDAGIVPVTFALGIVAALPEIPRMYGMALAASAVVLLATVFRHRAGSLRDAAVAATSFAVVGAITQILTGSPLLTTGAIAVFGAACFAANLLRPSRSWEGVGSLALGWSMLAAVGLLSEREAYVYAPFATPESALSAGVLAALFAAWRIVGEEQPPKLLKGGFVVWAFAWVHQELAFAFNPTAATLLRVSYYALTSVAAVWIGKAKSVAILRHLGLGLAVAAAGTALYSASELANTGARIAADLVAAGFLLAIAFWYRKPGSGAALEPPARQETPS